MYWDGDRWLPAPGTATARPQPPRRARDWASTAVMVIALVALVVPIRGAVATGDSEPVATPPPHTVVIQESNRQVRFSRGWRTATHPLYLGGAARETGVVDARATLRFTGSSIAWIGPSGPRGGTADVLVDGRLAATVDTTSPSLTPSTVLFQTSWPDVGSHRIVIVAKVAMEDRTVALDAFFVGTQPGGSSEPAVPAAPTQGPGDSGTAGPVPPTIAPTLDPTVDPTADPTLGPPTPTTGPTPGPTLGPPVDPTPAATPAPTPRPTAAPTPQPTLTSTPRPTASPTPRPTATPTPRPTASPTPTPRPTATPTPTPPPTPAPTPPTGTRPFAAPTTSGSFTVPGSIDATGATDVYDALNDWIDGVPNGSVINFPTDGVFKLSQGIKLGQRSNLILRGNGSTLRLTGSATNHQSSGFVIGWSHKLGYWTGGSSHITIRGFTVVGNDPTPGTFGGGENQQAVRCNGSTYIEITEVTVRAVYGDGAFLDNCNDVWVHHMHVATAGRNGLTVIKGQRVLGENNAYDKVGYATFDLEPNYASESSADITFRGNTAGTWQSGIGFVSIDGGGRGADIRRVTISNNRVTGMPLQIYVDNKDGVNGNLNARMRSITVTDNSGPSSGALRFRNIDGLTVLRNDGSITIIDCTDVVR